ncbi:thioredoxin-dependent thiol peroxidase [Aquirufa sp. KTFRIE-69F]|jgi:peroxiredoxin Q/BCP|uniref:thioredoxin-dependent peroxiredoxin n=1 Tax=Aquirufa originis TaxID=3096514 RepID=A0ABW6D3I2_9BACT|nr:thioredoxin-dependent thiol peroxidase [Aquirufa antheringensis]MCZ2476774.1 thioredoxin-dependent thiol peroxidase [Aquirufa antheringensis]
MKLQIGNAAPTISMVDSDGNNFAIPSGKKIVLYFYPKDNTPGCTAQACNLNENLDALQAKGFQVVGVSIDTNASHTKFKAKYNLAFPLLSDPEHQLAEAFGVWVEKSMYGKQYMGVARTTFIIDENGIIIDIIEKVDTKNHSSQIH